MSLNDDLVDKAKRYSQIEKIGDLLECALLALIEGKAADRLAALGGSDATASAPARRGTPVLAEGEAPYPAEPLS